MRHLFSHELMMTTFIHQISALADCIGHTPLVKLQKLGKGTNATLLAKLEGNNPAGSVKDRPAFHMISQAQNRGEINVGDTLIEATSGNTGIALAMVAAMQGYNMVLIMPAGATQERKDAMRAYGATLIEVDNMETARDLAKQMQADGKGKVLDQFNNADNWQAHYHITAPEIWQQTDGRITHFVSAMGTTGTIMGVSKFLKQKNPAIQTIGLQPAQGANIAGIRRWSAAYLPKIFDGRFVDTIIDVHEQDAINYMRQLAANEGIFCGVSSGGAAWAAHQIAKTNPHAVIAFVVCDRGDRYLSTGVFDRAQ